MVGGGEVHVPNGERDEAHVLAAVKYVGMLAAAVWQQKWQGRARKGIWCACVAVGRSRASSGSSGAPGGWRLRDSRVSYDSPLKNV